MISVLLSACQHLPEKTETGPGFSSQWQLNPAQHAEYIAAQSALGVHKARDILALNVAKEAATSQLMEMVARRAESGVGRRADLFLVQIELSKDKIRRIKSGEVLHVTERKFRDASDAKSSVDDVLARIPATRAEILPKQQADEISKSILRRYPGAQANNLFASLWSRYEAGINIAKQCAIVESLSDKILEYSGKSLSIGQVSVGNHLYTVHEVHADKLQCIERRYELRNIEFELSLLQHPG